MDEHSISSVAAAMLEAAMMLESEEEDESKSSALVRTDPLVRVRTRHFRFDHAGDAYHGTHIAHLYSDPF